MTRNKQTVNKAIISLLLLIPAPSVGVLFGMILFPDTALGQSIFVISKIWLFLFPAAWFFLIERSQISFGKTKRSGFKMGLITGLAISAFIVAASVGLSKSLIDPAVFKEMMNTAGLDKKGLYIGAAIYWVLINSVLEEYVWRWFTVRQCARVLHPPAAIIVSALGFTLHHILAMQTFFSWPVTLICASGICIGGMLWSWMFIRYKTIWPGWLSHALVDIAVFGTGYFMIFG